MIGVSKFYDKKAVLKDIYLSYARIASYEELLRQDTDKGLKEMEGGIIGIIGPNGAGKTTLFRMITGQEKPDSGTFRIGETVKLAYVDQSRNDLDPNKTIWEVITDGLEVVQGHIHLHRLLYL